MKTTVQLRRIARFDYGDALSSEIREDGDIPVVGSGGVSGFHTTANASGPAIVVGRKGSYGSIHWIDRDLFVIDTAYHVRPTSSETDLRWLYYAMQAVDLKGASQDVGVPGLSREAAYAVPIPASSLDEQCRIADFLDAETARLDQLVSLRNAQVNRLAEALQAEARRAQGAESRLLPLRRVIDSVQTGTTPTELLKPRDADSLQWDTPAALCGTLDLGVADKSIAWEDSSSVPRFPAKSILIVGIGESLGKIALLDHSATGNQQLTAITVSSSADRGFVAWRLFSAYEEIRAYAQYSRVRILNNEVLKSFRIPMSPIEQQIEMRKELDERLASFVEFRNAAARFSLLASERRQALITAAVTGGITV